MQDLWVSDNGKKRRRAYWKICPICNNKFLSRISYGKTFCSIDCKNINQEKVKTEFNCAWCGDKVERLSSKFRAKSGIYFCSKDCKNLAARLNGGIKEIHPHQYGTGEIHRNLFGAEELKCKRCGYGEFSVGVDIHHIDGNHKNNEKNNLVPLCAPCHRALHNKLWDIAALV